MSEELFLTFTCKLGNNHELCSGEMYFGNIFKDPPVTCDCGCHAALKVTHAD